MKRWRVRTGDYDKIVEAADQWAAWDALRPLPIADFGLLVTAEAEDTTPIAVRTSALMFRWYRDADGQVAIRSAIDRGFSDTTAADLHTAGR